MWALDGLEWVSERRHLLLIPAFAITAVATGQILHILAKRKRRKQWAKAGKDVVTLHGFGRGRFTPSISPFVMKLETYLRLAKIPYVFEDKEPMGPKGLSPWITLNGEDISDSQLVMEALAKKFNKDFTIKLPKEEQAVARAIDLMITEHIAWGLRVWRYAIDRGAELRRVMPSKFPLYMYLGTYVMHFKVKRALWMQGMGRHTNNEVEEIMRKDFASISSYLGEKPFVMGEEPTEVDCTLFGFTSQILWNYNGSPYVKMITEEFRNIEAHHLRVRELLYPDWTDLCPDAK